MNCGKQNHYARDCRQGQSIKAIKGITNPRLSNPKKSKELKGTKKCVVKHFVFYYDDRCPVYKKAKYSANYWLQKPSPN